MKKILIIAVFLCALFPLSTGAQQYDDEYEYDEPAPYDEPGTYDQYDESGTETRGYYGDEDEPEGYDYDPGDMTFTIVGSGSSDDEFDRTNFSTEATLGYFAVEYMQLFFRQSYQIVDISGDDDVWAATSRAGFDIVMDLERLKPFIGASAGYFYGDSEWVEDQWIAGPEAGLMIFATDTAYLFGLVEYQFLFEDADEADEQFDDGRYVYSLGVGFKF